MTDLSIAEERDAILRAAEYAPAVSHLPIAPGLLGWWTPGGWYVCSLDASRIFARGCTLPRGSTAVWTGEPTGVCLICSK